jgi:hypothetical protein
MRYRSSISVLSVAVLLLAPGWAQVPATSDPVPSPPPPPAIEAPPPVSDPVPALVTSVNIASLKAVFDNANVPVEVRTEANGFKYLVSTLYGNGVFVYPVDCKDGNFDGECAAVVIESGEWPAKLPNDKLVEFSRPLRLSHALAYEGGKPFLRYIFLVKPGVGPDFVRDNLSMFSSDMQEFAKFAAAIKAPAAGFSSMAGSGEVFSARPRVQKSLGSAAGGLSP